MKRRLSILGAVCLLLCAFGVAPAATRTWTGNSPVNSSWTNAANWGFGGGGTAPVAGDDLVFPPGNLRLANSNSFPAGTTFNSILFTGTNYSITGDAILLNAGVTNNAATAGDNRIDFPITLAASQTFNSLSSASSVLIIFGGVTNNGNTLNCAGTTIIINSIVSGGGGIQSSTSTLLLSAANTYSGTTVADSGFLTANTSLALGATSSDTTVNTGGTLGFQSNISVPEPITVMGRLINYSGTNTLTGELTLQSTPTSVDVRPNSMLILSNVVSGTGGLLKTNTGILRLTGNSDNTYLGSTTITAGTLLLDKPANKKTIPGDLTNSATVRLLNSEQISFTAAVTVSSNAVFDVNSMSQTIGSLSGPRGASVTLGSGTLSVGVDSSSTTFGGVISGTNGNLVKQGSGTFTLTGTNTHTGATTVNAGTLLVNGSQTNSPVFVSGGTLGGAGFVATISAGSGGVIAPGASVGILSVSNVTFNAATTFSVELDGAVPGSGHDQLKASGPVNLAGATLSLTLNYAPTNGTKFIILTNQGVSAIIGTFAGLPEGAILNSGGQGFVISYVGGNGNDVVLTSGCAAPCNLVVHDGPTPYLVYVRWDVPLGPVDQYIVYRNGYEVSRMDADIFLSFPLYYDPRLQPSHSYTYQVVATFTNGAVSLPSSPLVVVTPPATPVVGTNNVVSLMVRFADYIEEPYSTNYVNALMFTNQYSVAAYYREASYGQYSLQGSTHGWYTLPGYASNYCSFFNSGNGLWYGPNFGLIIQDTFNVIPASVSNLVATADIVQYLVNGLGTVGLSGGSFKMYAATNGFSVGSVLHEISHGINNYGHSGGWHNLPGGYSAGPDVFSLYSGGCILSTYGDWWDPLGGGATVHHSTYFKEHAGWLGTNNIQWIDHDGDYQLWSLEQATNKVQMLKFDLGQEMFYFFEYRTMTGFDGPDTPGPGLSPIDAVVGRLRLSYSQGGDMETLIPYPKPLGVPQVFNPGTPFLDPYRGLRVEVVAKGSGVATLRVSGLTNIFGITKVRTTGGAGQNVELTFNSLPEVKYLAQASTNFNTWQTVKTNILAPTNSTVTVLTNGGTLPNRFFRIGVDNTDP